MISGLIRFSRWFPSQNRYFCLITLTLSFIQFKNEDDVGRWRNAMKEAAALAGMELKNTFNGVKSKVGDISPVIHVILHYLSLYFHQWYNCFYCRHFPGFVLLPSFVRLDLRLSTEFMDLFYGVRRVVGFFQVLSSSHAAGSCC
ncbi:hypothetical protein QVD17_27676 [Tagetes erecta]|uniref:Uncharacterized protein n=1 Tax=Tagetes erecta TaxID=13708 RepID=A0AAD8NRZ5_TARER|nr:hypothetical protein QVD17_27676 [Tagetes erecta]